VRRTRRRTDVQRWPAVPMAAKRIPRTAISTFASSITTSAHPPWISRSIYRWVSMFVCLCVDAHMSACKWLYRSCIYGPIMALLPPSSSSGRPGADRGRCECV
jgi:hypothetical protein